MSPIIHEEAHTYGGSSTYFINGVFQLNGVWTYWLVSYNELPLKSLCVTENDGFFKKPMSLDVVSLQPWILDNVADIDAIQAQLRKKTDLNILTNSAGPNRGRIRHNQGHVGRRGWRRRYTAQHWRLLTDTALVNNIKLGITWRALNYGALVPVFRVDKGVWCIQLSARGINA